MQIGMANKIIIPAMAAVKFPNLEVNFSDGKTLKLPFGSNGNKADAESSTSPKTSLLCLSFRASSQVWIMEFEHPFDGIIFIHLSWCFLACVSV